MLKPSDGQTHLLNLLSQFGYHQCMDMPTRTTKTTRTCIDLVITSKPGFLVSASSNLTTISDHNIVTCKLRIPKTKKPVQTFTFRSYKHFSEADFISDLWDAPFWGVYQRQTTEEQWKHWLETYQKVLDGHAPVVTFQSNEKSAPWFNGEVRASRSERDRRHHAAVTTGDPDLWEQYRRATGQTKACVKTAKRVFLQGKLDSSTSQQQMWRTLRAHFTPGTSGQQPHADALKTAELFNEYFANIGSNINRELRDIFGPREHQDHNLSGPEFHLSTVSISTVKKAVGSMDNKAGGADQVTIKLLKAGLPALASTLTYVINSSLSSGHVPSGWKEALVIPVHKSWQIDEPKNHRPISLLSAVNKVTERLVDHQLTVYLEENQLLELHQYGFRRGRSTEMALLSITEPILREMGNQNLSLLQVSTRSVQSFRLRGS